MNLYLTSPNFTTALRLAEAIAERGVNVCVVEFGKTPQREPAPDDRWLVLAPKELPPFAPLPKCEYGVIDVEAPLATQVGLAVQELEWGKA